MATVFNLANRSVNTTGGYTRATRAGLSAEAQVKVKESAVQKILKPPLTANVQVSTFDPAHMSDRSNFFNFVGNWRADSQTIRQHCTAYYLHNVFDVASVSQRQAVDATGNPRVDATTGDPIMEDYVRVGESLFDIWHNIDQSVLEQSITIYALHAEDVDRQNLQWSWELIIRNIDPDLKHFVMSHVEGLASHVGQTGPMAFYVVAKRIVTSTNNLAHNVISGVMVLKLQHFPGEDVTECIFVLRNVLKFLNHGHATFDRTPPTIMEYLVEVFLRATNSQFVHYVQNLRDFHNPDIDTPEKLFTKVQEYYDRIITSQGKIWLPTRRQRSAFAIEAGEPAPPSQPRLGPSVPMVQPPTVENPPAVPPPAQAQAAAAPAPAAPRARSTYVPDRTPPGPGEPHSRLNIRGWTEHWCDRCPRGGHWGNHLSEDHNEWFRAFNQRRANQGRPLPRAPRSEPAQAPAAPEGPGSMGNAAVSAAPAGPRSVLRRTFVSFQDDSDSD